MRALSAPEGLPSAVEIWFEQLQFDDEPAAADWSLLAPAEAERARRHLRRADRVRAVRGRAQLRRLLGERLGVAPGDLQFAIGAHGKPALLDEQPFSFNLAHGGEMLLIALDARGHGIGVDVEPSERRHAAAEVLTPWLSPAERCGAMPALCRWVAKEAVLKALGVGIAEHLGALAVIERTAGGPRLCFGEEKSWPLESGSLAKLRVWPLAAAAHHEAALCCRAEETD